MKLSFSLLVSVLGLVHPSFSVPKFPFGAPLITRNWQDQQVNGLGRKASVHCMFHTMPIEVLAFALEDTWSPLVNRALCWSPCYTYTHLAGCILLVYCWPSNVIVPVV